MIDRPGEWWWCVARAMPRLAHLVAATPCSLPRLRAASNPDRARAGDTPGWRLHDGEPHCDECVARLDPDPDRQLERWAVSRDHGHRVVPVGRRQ